MRKQKDKKWQGEHELDCAMLGNHLNEQNEKNDNDATAGNDDWHFLNGRDKKDTKKEKIYLKKEKPVRTIRSS